MIRRAVRGIQAVGLLFLVGCVSPVREKIDDTVCELAAQPRDLQPLTFADSSPPPQPQDNKTESRPPGRLTVPDDLLPTGKVPDISLPRLPDERDPQRQQKEKARTEAVSRLFPPLPALGEDLPDPPGPAGRPYTLSDLQKLALANSPLIRQAAARVKEAEGAAIQAGLPPNPNIGYEADTIGTSGGPGYQGGFIEQKIIVSNKLQLARAVAAMDLKNATLALFRAQTDLATRVRSAYFAVLVAHESVRINHALVKFAGEVYQNQVKRVQRGGLAAPHEAMYLRALATQTRANLIQARNRRIAAWKELAATLGLPGLPPTQLAGRLDIPLPLFDHKNVLTFVLTHHSDVRTAENALQRAHFSLELAKTTPIPDPDVRLMIQKDRTGPPYEVAPSLQLVIPLPIWDRNQGGILQAEAGVVRQAEEPHRVRADLTRALAEAFERYESNRVLLGYYRDQILPDLVRVYKGELQRYRLEGPREDRSGVGSAPPGFNDLVLTQQNLAQSITAYIATLGQAWQGVVDVADLLQTKDLFGVNTPTQPVAGIPDLDHLTALPCCHPCSPLPETHQAVIDRDWPNPTSAGSTNPNR